MSQKILHERDVGGHTTHTELAETAVEIDGTLSYYTWNELSRNIEDAVTDGLPEGYDYSEWVPDGELASGGVWTPIPMSIHEPTLGSIR